MIGIARSPRRRLAVVGGLAAALVVATLAMPTSAAYRATPATASMENLVGLDWDIPTVPPIGGRLIEDAAYHPGSGHTYMLPKARGVKYTTGDIYVSESPGAEPVAVSLPSIGKSNSYIYQVAVENAYNKLAVLMKPDPADPLSLATFSINADGSLTFDGVVALTAGHGTNATGVAMDAQRGRVAVAYWWITGSTSDSRVEEYQVGSGPGLLAYLELPGIPNTMLKDVSVTPHLGDAIAVSLSGGTPGCAAGSSIECRFSIFDSLGAEATHPTEVWSFDSNYVKRGTVRGGNLGAMAGFGSVGAHGLGVERDSATVFHAVYGQSEISRLYAPPGILRIPVVAETIPIGGKVRLLISGHGVVMVLLDDGSLGWLIA